MSDTENENATHGGGVGRSECPQVECQCEDWPPAECPQCGAVILGATPSDWYEHFGDECETLGQLYCFASKESEVKA